MMYHNNFEHHTLQLVMEMSAAPQSSARTLRLKQISITRLKHTSELTKTMVKAAKLYAIWKYL